MTSTIENQRAIFVLGMHRSGTSALARVLNLMGVDLGIGSEAAGKDNQRGFWENPELNLIDENILKSLNSSWQDLHSLPNQWWKTNTLGLFVSKKDPQLCRLLPLGLPNKPI